MDQDDALGKLARQIDATRRFEQLSWNPLEVGIARRRGACELYKICADFTGSVNSRLAVAALEISPPTYAAEMFREPGANIFQISSEGRQIQITFSAPAQLVSTDKFTIPYVLEGEIRTYNQEMLEHFEVRTRGLFYCLERDRAIWRTFDWRSANASPLSTDLLVGLMEPLF